MDYWLGNIIDDYSLYQVIEGLIAMLAMGCPDNPDKLAHDAAAHPDCIKKRIRFDQAKQHSFLNCPFGANLI